jgi:hypothetical protein
MALEAAPSEARQATVEANPGFFVWGAIFWFQALATYTLVYLAQRRSDPALLSLIRWAWIVPGFVGYAVSAWRLSQAWKGERTAFETFAARTLTALWMAVFFSMAALNVVIGLTSGFRGESYPLYLAMTTIVLAVPLLVTGTACGIRSFTWLSAGFWLGAVTMAAAGPHWAVLLFGLIAGGGFLLAGLVLHPERRRPSHEASAGLPSAGCSAEDRGGEGPS